MDEYLSEKEQIERFRQWWSDNSWYLLAGVVIGVVTLFGYRQWQASVENSSETAAIIYRQVEQAAIDDNIEEMERLFEQLDSDYRGTPYFEHAAFLLAANLIISNTNRAADILRRVMNESDDEAIATIARLRLARVLAYQERYDDAMALLDSADDGAFAARISEIRGDIAHARGQINDAMSSYAEALGAPGSDFIDRSYVQMKLSNLMTSADVAVAVDPVDPVDLVDPVAPVDASEIIEVAE